MTTIKIWELGSPKSQNRRAWWVSEEMKSEGVVCPANAGHRRGGKRLTDLSVSLPGKTVEDFVWTWYSECLIQDHVLERFRAERFTGFEVKPVKARFKKIRDVEPPRLLELIVTGWGGLASLASGVKLTRCCDSCGDLTYSTFTDPKFLFDVSKWDGSDFFMIWPLPKFIFVTDRVAQFIREQRFSGVTLLGLDQLKPGDGFGPGRLSYWMPDARARELGKPLGIY